MILCDHFNYNNTLASLMPVIQQLRSCLVGTQT